MRLGGFLTAAGHEPQPAPEPLPEPLRHVVVLTSPDGHRTLSNASLMGAREAEAEAGQWRRRGWVAVVGEVT